MRYAMTGIAVAMLAACSGGNTSIQPGNWETTTRMTTVEAPGMPEPMLAQIRSQLANQSQTQSSCITPEQAANPTGGLLSGSDSSGCQFTDSHFSGGEIRVNGTCPGPGGPGSMRMTMEGTYTETTMEGTVSTEMSAPPGAPGGVENIRMSGTFNSRRTGECPSG